MVYVYWFIGTVDTAIAFIWNLTFVLQAVECMGLWQIVNEFAFLDEKKIYTYTYFPRCAMHQTALIICNFYIYTCLYHDQR